VFQSIPATLACTAMISFCPRGIFRRFLVRPVTAPGNADLGQFPRFVAVNKSVTEPTSLQLIEVQENCVCFFDLVTVKHRNELAEFVRIETSSVIS
jgi:hypothetical protein